MGNQNNDDDNTSEDVFHEEPPEWREPKSDKSKW